MKRQEEPPQADLLCSFCGKSQRQVMKLIAGPGVYVCDECVDLCNEILDEERRVRGHTRTSEEGGDVEGEGDVRQQEDGGGGGDAGQQAP